MIHLRKNWKKQILIHNNFTFSVISVTAAYDDDEVLIIVSCMNYFQPLMAYMTHKNE